MQKTNKNIPRRNKYILENILLNIFKFYTLKYIIKFLQSHDNNKNKKFGFHNFAEHRLKTSALYCGSKLQREECGSRERRSRVKTQRIFTASSELREHIDLARVCHHRIFFLLIPTKLGLDRNWTDRILQYLLERFATNFAPQKDCSNYHTQR